MNSAIWDERTTLLEGFFTGYAFIGVDYVYGQQGADDFRRITGGPVPGGHDGCYLTVRKEGDSFVFETDYAGFQTLYYFVDGNNWAVSGSWAELIDHLRVRGLPIRPNHSVLVSAGPWMSNQQLATFETPVHGVHLVPRHQRLVVDSRGPRLESATAGESVTSNYESAIQETLALWLGRIQTLLASDHGLQLSLDISGGRDSRVIFALYMATIQRMREAGVQQRNQLRLVSSLAKRSTADLSIAKDLAAHYGLPLNEAPQRKAPRLKDAERWSAWRSNSLGTYFPMVLPRERMNGSFIHFGGNAAGNQRSVYQEALRVSTVDAFVDRHVERIESPVYAQEYQASLYRAFSDFPPGLNDNQLLGEHYRQFRGRLHGSAYALPRVCFFPFASQGFDVARESGGAERFEDAQVNYDIMGLIEPTLLDFPYDDPAKLPTDKVRSRLLTGASDDLPSAGRIYGDLEEEGFPQTNDQNQSLAELVSSAFKDAETHAYVAGLLPSTLTSKAADQVSLFAEKGHYPKPGASWPVTPHMAARLIAPRSR